MTEQIKRSRSELRKMAVAIYYMKKVAERFNFSYARHHQDKYTDFMVQIGPFGVYCADAESKDTWVLCYESHFGGSLCEPPSSDVSDLETFDSFSDACNKAITRCVEDALVDFQSDLAMYREWRENQHEIANSRKKA